MKLKVKRLIKGHKATQTAEREEEKEEEDQQRETYI